MIELDNLLGKILALLLVKTRDQPSSPPSREEVDRIREKIFARVGIPREYLERREESK